MVLNLEMLRLGLQPRACQATSGRHMSTGADWAAVPPQPSIELINPCH